MALTTPRLQQDWDTHCKSFLPSSPPRRTSTRARTQLNQSQDPKSVVERVQSWGVWRRLCWRRGEAGRRRAELQWTQPRGSGRARCAPGVRVWRTAGGRRAPTLRSRRCPQVSLAQASAGKPTAGLHLRRWARISLQSLLT